MRTLLFVAVLLGARGARAADAGQATVVVYPAFSPSMDSPTFVVELTNHGDHNLDYNSLMKVEAAELDGKVLPRLFMVLHELSSASTGGKGLQPGKTWTRLVSVMDFLGGIRDPPSTR